ncbi:MAG: hypothetical protein RIT03_49 [Bacteroidota bacterium]|jgi:hypothetical protein
MRFSNECLTIGFKDFTHIYNLRSEKIASSFLLAMTCLVLSVKLPAPNFPLPTQPRS